MKGLALPYKLSQTTEVSNDKERRFPVEPGMTRHNVGPGAMGALKNNPSGGLVVGVAEGPVGEPGGEGGLEVGGGAGDGVGADVGQNLGKVVFCICRLRNVLAQARIIFAATKDLSHD